MRSSGKAPACKQSPIDLHAFVAEHNHLLAKHALNRALANQSLRRPTITVTGDEVVYALDFTAQDTP